MMIGAGRAAASWPMVNSLWPSEVDDPPRILSREDMARIITRVKEFARGDGGTGVWVRSWWNGELRWGRNRVTLASDRRDISVEVIRRLPDGRYERAFTNQTDDVSLEGVVRSAERNAQFGFTGAIQANADDTHPPVLEVKGGTVWSDRTFQVTADERGALANVLTVGAEDKGLLSAGYLEVRAGAEMSDYEVGMGWDVNRTVLPPIYQQFSQGQCSMTVRHPRGIGSGWAGLSSYDWSAIDGRMLAEHALSRCVASLNPVAIEPGRYTVILEPQAVATLVDLLLTSSAFSRKDTEAYGMGPFFLGRDDALLLGRSKLGLQVVDERITLEGAPDDPSLGTLAVPGGKKVIWIEHGVLMALAQEREYGLMTQNENLPECGVATRESALDYGCAFDGAGGIRMSGGETSVEEMLAATKRGLLVTRFSGAFLMDSQNLLSSGVTRDGLWLIENGKITKAVKNMRFTESPLFVLNQVDQLGKPVPVFKTRDWGVNPMVVPPVKVNDFSFTSMVDAI